MTSSDIWLTFIGRLNLSPLPADKTLDCSMIHAAFNIIITSTLLIIIIIMVENPLPCVYLTRGPRNVLPDGRKRSLRFSGHLMSRKFGVTWDKWHPLS